MYTDDTNLISAAEHPDVLEFKMNLDMNLNELWLKANINNVPLVPLPVFLVTPILRKNIPCNDVIFMYK